MTQRSDDTTDQTGADGTDSDRAANLLALFAREGFRRIEPSVLQPVDAFLDLSGEDIRRHMFLTQDADGNELCLRPDYTIPVSRDYLAAYGGEETAAFSYFGPVFRQRAGRAGEFPQAGVELFGRHDRDAADAEIVALGYEALTGLGVANPVIRMGDIGLFNALLDGLRLSAVQRRRILRAVSEGRALGETSAGAPPAPANHAGLLAALEGQDKAAARAFVEDVLSIAGISSVGGRTAGEIAERFLARAADRNSGDTSAEQHAVLAHYLAIDTDPDSAAAAIRALARDADIDLDEALDAFEARTGFIAARGLDVAAIGFAAGFARNLDYYTGFIFEIHDSAQPDTRPILGGGRYDSLLSHLGATAPVPAVGFAVWIDRLQGAGSATGDLS